MTKITSNLAIGATFALLSTASSAEVFGPLANFDIVNNTGSTAHGFEIEMHGIHKTDITSIFGDVTRWSGMERYDAPTVVESTDAQGLPVVTVTYQSTVTGGKWKAGTPSGVVPTPHDSCWPLGTQGFIPAGKTIYDSVYPCDHFGISARINPIITNYRWLTEVSPGSTNLTKVDVNVPSPVFTVTPNPAPPVLVQPPAPAPGAPLPPPVLQPQPPIVNVVVAAPQPNAYEFGEARWVKVTATGTIHDMAVEDLVADNAALKNAKQQMQTEWQLLQVDAGKPGSGQIDLTGVALDQGATGVVYRFEFYKYTGYHDPETYEAKSINGDTATPAPSDLGPLIAAQNAAVNFDGNIPPAPPLPIAPAINQQIAGGVVGQAYSQVIAGTPANPGDVLTYTVTGLPAGLSFDAATNTITGTPSAVGSFPLTIIVNDVTNGLSTTATTSISIAYAPVVFDVAFPNATQYSPFSYQFTATGNGAITYSILEALPDGLSLNADILSGTPIVSGNFPLHITAKDAQGFTQPVAATLKIDAAPAPVVPPAPPVPVACSGTNALINSADQVAQTITLNGGNVVSYTAQNLVINAPLTAANAFTTENLATYTGTMNIAGTTCVADKINISQGLSFAVPTMPNGTVGVAYTPVPVAPTGGVQPYTIAVSNLPAGLAFTNGNIDGTPTVSGTFTISISINDNNGQTIFYSPTLTIDPAAPAAVACSGNNEIITNAINVRAGIVETLGGPANGGSAIQIFQATTTIVPPLTTATFFKTGNLITYTGTLAQGVCVTTSATVSPPPPVVVSATFGNGIVGVPYTANVTMSGGASALKLSVSNLPAGLSVSGSSITGIPTIGGIFNVVLTGTDNFGNQSAVTVPLTIAPAPAVNVSASLPTGQVGSTYPTTAVNVSGGYGSINTVVNGLPAGLSYANGSISGSPTVSGTFNVTITSTDSLGTIGKAAISLVINSAPVAQPVSCTMPKGAIQSAAKSTITAVNGFTISTKAGVTLNVLACATIEWNRSTHIYKVGDVIEWKGWKNGSVVDTTIVTLN